MPELPEVETICRGLAPLISNRRVTAVRSSGKKLRLPMPLSLLRDKVVSHVITGVERRAKFILIHLDNGAPDWTEEVSRAPGMAQERPTLVLHLGMSGRLLFLPVAAPPATHDHFILTMDGWELRFNDPRRFGSVQVARSGAEIISLFAGLGPEPLGEGFSPDYLLERARDRTRPVKPFLMDSAIVVGIGNIYASEILFTAAVHPARTVGSLSPGQWQAIVLATRQVLTSAIAQGGTTISDFAGPDGAAGYFQHELHVYGREGKACPRCGKATILRTVMAGRATFHCPSCQGFGY